MKIGDQVYKPTKSCILVGTVRAIGHFDTGITWVLCEERDGSPWLSGIEELRSYKRTLPLVLSGA